MFLFNIYTIRGVLFEVYFNSGWLVDEKNKAKIGRRERKRDQSECERALRKEGKNFREESWRELISHPLLTPITTMNINRNICIFLMKITILVLYIASLFFQVLVLLRNLPMCAISLYTLDLPPPTHHYLYTSPDSPIRRGRE